MGHICPVGWQKVGRFLFDILVLCLILVCGFVFVFVFVFVGAEEEGMFCVFYSVIV